MYATSSRRRPGVKAFCQNVLEDVLVQTQVGNKLFQLPVFILKLFQTPQLCNAQAAVHLLPAVERLL